MLADQARREIGAARARVDELRTGSDRVESRVVVTLEADAAAGGLYGAPDGWMDAHGVVRDAPVGSDPDDAFEEWVGARSDEVSRVLALLDQVRATAHPDLATLTAGAAKLVLACRPVTL